jgi:hypothetical protein
VRTRSNTHFYVVIDGVSGKKRVRKQFYKFLMEYHYSMEYHDWQSQSRVEYYYPKNTGLIDSELLLLGQRLEIMLINQFYAKNTRHQLTIL